MKRLLQSFVALAVFALTAASIQPQCLESKFHKAEPSSEGFLHGACSSWQSMSCCTKNTTEQFHTVGAWRGFNYNHCGKLSDSCKAYFLKELCLYECDPYLAQWTVKDASKKMRNQRYYKIPLCQNDCNDWFNACKDDFTCRDNWNKGFKWISTKLDGEQSEIKMNFCPAYETCETFKAKFKDARNFCNRIWDDAFEVTNSSRCISFSLRSGQSNQLASQDIFVEKYGREPNGCNYLRSSINWTFSCLLVVFAIVLLV